MDDLRKLQDAELDRLHDAARDAEQALRTHEATGVVAWRDGPGPAVRLAVIDVVWQIAFHRLQEARTRTEQAIVDFYARRT